MTTDQDTDRPTSHGAARGYSWPPFEEGNHAATKHGAQSPRRLAPIVAELKAQLLEAAPWCAPAAFAPAVESWAAAEAQCRLLRSWLDEVGMLDEVGEPRKALATLDRADVRADRARKALGLSPSSWAQLLKAMTVAPDGSADPLAALRRTGAEIIEARSQATTDPALPAPVPEEADDGHFF